MSSSGVAVMSIDPGIRQQLQAAPYAAGPHNAHPAIESSAVTSSTPRFSPAAFLDKNLPAFSATSPDSAASVAALLTSLEHHSDSLQSQHTALLSSSASLFASHSSQLKEQDDSFRSLTSSYTSLLSSLQADLVTLAPLTSALSSLSSSSSALNRAHIYLLLLTRCNEYSDLARQQAETQPQQAAKTILQLSRLYQQVREEADGGAGAGVRRLQAVLHHRLLYLLHVTKERLFASYRDCLDALHWPQTQQMLLDTTNEQLITTFCELTETLLVLQIEADQDNAQLAPPAPSQPLSPVSDRLWIFQLLFSPLHVRFQYHFTGDKPTNRLDKPEWMLSFISNVLTLHSPFLTTYVQPILLRSPLAYISPQLSLISSLLGLLRAKLGSSLPLLLSRPVLLRHTIDELLAFESALRVEHRYPEEEEGVTELLCKDGRGEVFERWLSVDKEWVNDRLNAMREMKDPWKRVSDGREGEDGLGLTSSDDVDSDDEDARDIRLETDADGRDAEDDADSGAGLIAGSAGVGMDVASSDPSLIVTRSSHMLVTLVSSITSRFTVLPYLSARLRFVQDIQYQLLDIYLEWLEDEARALLPAVTSAMSAPSASLRVYCMIVNSIYYVERVLSDWSDDVTFIELRYFQAHSELPASTTVRQLVERIGSAGAAAEDVDVDGSVFDAMIVNYHDGRERMIKGIVDAVVQCFHTLTRTYRKLGHQDVVGEDDSDLSSVHSRASSTSLPASSPPSLSRQASSALSVSPLFVPALLTLKLQLLSLHRHLSSPLFTLVWTRIASRLDTLLFATCIHQRLFSASGAAQLAYDINALLLLFRQWGGGGGVGRWLGSVMDAMVLLQMKWHDVEAMERGMDGGAEDVQWLDRGEDERRRRWRERWKIRKLTEDDVRAIIDRRRQETRDGHADGDVEVEGDEDDNGEEEKEEDEDEEQEEAEDTREAEALQMQGAEAEQQPHKQDDHDMSSVHDTAEAQRAPTQTDSLSRAEEVDGSAPAAESDGGDDDDDANMQPGDGWDVEL